MRTTANLTQIAQLVDGTIAEPFALLGPHPYYTDCDFITADRNFDGPPLPPLGMGGKDDFDGPPLSPLKKGGKNELLAVRAFLPSYQQAWVVDKDLNRRPMRKIHPAGVFEAVCADLPAVGPGQYQIEAADRHGKSVKMHDPYAFPPLLTEYDLHLLNEGKHWQSYSRLGAQLRTVDGVKGVNFVVWAPNATSICVRGDFNEWDPKRHPMRKHIPSGFWELFVPGIGVGAQYKFFIRYGNETLEKCDPYGFATECPPRTANIVTDLTATSGTTTSGWPPASARRRWTGRCRSMKFTWEAGADPMASVGATIAKSPSRWWSTSSSRATRTLNYCRWPSIR